jgi:hypothetical protein
MRVLAFFWRNNTVILQRVLKIAVKHAYCLNM